MAPPGNPPPVRRLEQRLVGDAGRTIMRFFCVGDQRTRKIIDRVVDLVDARSIVVED